MSKIKIYKILLAVLIAASIIVAVLVAIKHVKLYKNEKETKQVIANITQSLENNEEVTNKIDESIQGHKVVGIIKI